MIEIVKFPGRTADQRVAEGEAHIVKVLEETLALANAGQIHAVAIAMVIADGSTKEDWAAPWCNHRLMSAITYLQYRYAHHEVSRSRDN